jgi:hypothetical protein
MKLRLNIKMLLHLPSSSHRPQITTLAPSLAKSIAVSRPIPEVPPVIKTTLFSNL